jgi:DmsE family decaheme c-type cytochrome
MRVPHFFDRGTRGVRIAAALGVAAILMFSFVSRSIAGDCCDDACLHARLMKAFAGHPGGDPAKLHDAAVAAYLKKIHSGVLGAAAADRIAADAENTHSALSSNGAASDPDLSRDIANYLKTAPSKASSMPDDGWTARKVTKLAQADLPAGHPPVDDGRSYVGQKVCMSCHQQEADNWAHTIHAKIFGLNPQNALEGRGCEACHGPGSEHIKNPSDLSTIISFSSKSKTPVPIQNGQCLSCHSGGPRIFWHASIHETNNLACSDCHNPMANFAAHGLTARESINETCFQCHKEQRAEFSRRSHMPLLEGKITCVDCHNPHGSTTAPLLKADSVNEVCYGCHAEKRGPFIFEHAPVRENCLNCHTPHGSNFESLLTTPRPMLCQQCHAQNGHPAELLTSGNMPMGAIPDPRLMGSSCQNCHSEIHGSNSPAGARFER